MRRLPQVYSYLYGDFNPRTPYGMRQYNEPPTLSRLKISIHAPLTGCDKNNHSEQHLILLFQSTHPLRDATLASFGRFKYFFLFQSTHPLRDATDIDIVTTSYISLFQSTHPLRDATSMLMYQGHMNQNFNPRTPYGMRPNRSYRYTRQK